MTICFKWSFFIAPGLDGNQKSWFFLLGLKYTLRYEGMNIKKEPLWKSSYCFSENIFAHWIAHDTLYICLFFSQSRPQFSVWWQAPSHWIVHFRAKQEILLQNIYVHTISCHTHHCGWQYISESILIVFLYTWIL